MKKKLLAGVTAALVGLSLSPMVSANAATPLQKEIAAINSSGDTFQYWIGLIFSDAANAAAVNQIKAWGASRGIKVNPVLVNQNNLTSQITAALTAGTMPDAFDSSSGLMLQLGSKNLVNVQALHDELAAKYGGLNKAATQFNLSTYAGKGLGVPYGISGNMVLRRVDLIKASGGSSQPPKTWEEALTMAYNAQKVGGWAFNTGNVGDGETHATVIFSDYGGRVGNDEGTKCTIDAQGTKDWLTFVKKAYDKGLYPSDSSNSDGAWDNNKYLGGKTPMIINTGSVYTTLIGGSATWDKNPTMAKNTGFSALPAGPVMQIAPSDGWLRVISKSSKYPELSKDLIRYLMNRTNMQEYYSQAIYGPVFKGLKTFPFWRVANDPARAGLYLLATAGTAGLYPDANNAQNAEFHSGFGLSKLLQAYLYGGKTMTEAIAASQASCQAIYDKYKK